MTCMEITRKARQLAGRGGEQREETDSLTKAQQLPRTDIGVREATASTGGRLGAPARRRNSR